MKTKLFDNRDERGIDVAINDFISIENRELVDVKMIAVEENYFTQCEYVALVIYKP